MAVITNNACSKKNSYFGSLDKNSRVNSHSEVMVYEEEKQQGGQITSKEKVRSFTHDNIAKAEQAQDDYPPNNQSIQDNNDFEEEKTIPTRKHSIVMHKVSADNIKPYGICNEGSLRILAH